MRNAEKLKVWKWEKIDGGTVRGCEGKKWKIRRCEGVKVRKGKETGKREAEIRRPAVSLEDSMGKG